MSKTKPTKTVWTAGTRVVCITKSMHDNQFIQHERIYTVRNADIDADGTGLVILEERPGFVYLAEHFEPATPRAELVSAVRGMGLFTDPQISEFVSAAELQEGPEYWTDPAATPETVSAVMRLYFDGEK